MPEGQKAVSRIALYREKKGLTQLQLSQSLGVTVTTIQNWEKGRAGVEQIERVINLCKVLECEPEDLIEYVPAPIEEIKPKRNFFDDKLTQATSSEVNK